jgi:hypothetical protein
VYVSDEEAWSHSIWLYNGAVLPCLLQMSIASTQPPTRWVSGPLSPMVKQPGREGDRSPPSSAEVKNAWSYTSTPSYVFMKWCLVKHRDNFIFFTVPRPKKYFSKITRNVIPVCTPRTTKVYSGHGREFPHEGVQAFRGSSHTGISVIRCGKI